MQTTRRPAPAARCSCIATQRPSAVRWGRVAAPRCSSQDAACVAQRGARPSISKRSRKAPGRREMRVNAGYQPFHFDESQYHRVEFASEPYGPLVVGAPQTHLKCVLVFQAADAPAPLSAGSQVMEVFVSGDACIGLYALLQRQKAERPMALDILWQTLLRGQDLSNKNWGLLRVAIVDIQGDIYHARMFFGDAETNTVMWDIDCRPSDATFLALKAKAPIFISREVWAKCALPLRDSASYEAVQMAKEHRRARAAEAARHAGGSGAGGVPEDGITPEVLLPVKLLQRELEVAVAEEAYDTAARLRDHPWMRLAADIELHKSIGYHVEAKRLFAFLKEQIEAQESQDGEDYETKLIRQHKQDQAASSSNGASSSSGDHGSSGGERSSSSGGGAAAAAQADEIKSERTFD